MSDFYQNIANSSAGNRVFSAINLPIPLRLERYSTAANSFVMGDVLVGAAAPGKTIAAVLNVLKAAPDATIKTLVGMPSEADIQKASVTAGVSVANYSAERDDKKRFKALILDATEIRNTVGLRVCKQFFQPVIRKLASCGRVVVIGRPPEQCDLAQRIAQRGLEGLVKSLGKEIGNGATANLVYVAEGAETQLLSSLQFFLSPRSAYVSGQLVRVGAAEFDAAAFDWKQPLAGKLALVTGAARGIGAAIAETMARDGARVMVLDIPPMADDLAQLASRIGGVAVEADITVADTPAIITNAAKQRGGLDIIVHNAGITRDKTMAGMKDQLWNTVIDVNSSSQERINAQLLADGGLKANGRIVCVSSISGIAGNLGQSNYATSKASVIGMVQGMAPELAANNITINAVAPGFIETRMTAAIPFAIREAGRRMNSLKQGGLPVDVAEAICYFASTASQGVSGNVMRVCGQSLLGA